MGRPVPNCEHPNLAAFRVRDLGAVHVECVLDVERGQRPLVDYGRAPQTRRQARAQTCTLPAPRSARGTK